MVPFYESVLQVQCRSWKKTDCLYFDRPFFWVPLLSSIRCQSFFCSVWLVRKANEYMQTSMIHNHQHGSEPIFQLDLSHAGLSFSFRHAGVGLPGKMLWLLVLVQFGSLGLWWVSQNSVWNLVIWIECIDMTAIYSLQCASEQKSSQNTGNLNATNGFWYLSFPLGRNFEDLLGFQCFSLYRSNFENSLILYLVFCRRYQGQWEKDRHKWYIASSLLPQRAYNVLRGTLSLVRPKPFDDIDVPDDFVLPEGLTIDDDW